MTRFAEEYNYKLDVVVSVYEDLIIGTNQGTYDIVGAGFEIDEERRDVVHFATPDRRDDVVALVKDRDVKESFSDIVKAGFRRTFINDDRYLDIGHGIGITLIITLCAAIFGTIGGFVLYFLNRDGGRVVRAIIEGFCTLLDRIPSLVILMILYYIIFANAPISATAVAVVSFSLIFSIEIFDNLVTSVEAAFQQRCA